VQIPSLKAILYGFAHSICSGSEQILVFYNGEEKQPEQYELKLSDAFEHPMSEVSVKL
jgi:hypothetical protein